MILFTDIIPKKFWIYPEDIDDNTRAKIKKMIEDRGGVVNKRYDPGTIKLGSSKRLYPKSVEPIYDFKMIAEIIRKKKWGELNKHRLRTLDEDDPENEVLERSLKEAESQLRGERSVHFFGDVQVRTIRSGGHICNGVIPNMIQDIDAGIVRGLGRLRISPHRPVLFNQGIQFPNLEREATRPPTLADGSFVRAWQVGERIAFLTNWEQQPLTLGRRAIPQWEHWEQDQMLLYIFEKKFFNQKKGRAFWEKARTENIYLAHRSQDALKHQWISKSMKELIQEKITGRLKKKFLADPLLKEQLPHDFQFHRPGDEEDDHYQT